jgi:hypothetical protein
MKEKLIKLFGDFGIKIDKNKILKDIFNRLDWPNEDLSKQYELFLMDLLVGLNSIKSIDFNSYNRYVKNLNETKGEINFWGEKFEVFMHSKLVKINTHVINDLRRGVDGKEPDLILKFNGIQLGLELTTTKFLEPPDSKEKILKKILDCIIEKNGKSYPNEKCALLIDITNLIMYEKVFNISLNKLFEESFSGFDFTGKDIGFGCVILCNSIFKLKADGNLYHYLNPRIGLFHETKPMNQELKDFLDIIFSKFKHDNDFELAFYHKNI